MGHPAVKTTLYNLCSVHREMLSTLGGGGGGGGGRGVAQYIRGIP